MRNYEIIDFKDCPSPICVRGRNGHAWNSTAQSVTERATPAHITKIGKKYVTTDNGIRFRVPVSGPAPYLEEHSDYSPDVFLFRNLTDAIEFEAIHRLSDEIKELAKRLPDGWKTPESYPTTDELNEIKNLLEQTIQKTKA